MNNISINKINFFDLKQPHFLLENKAVLKDYLLNMSFRAFGGKNFTF